VGSKRRLSDGNSGNTTVSKPEPKIIKVPIPTFPPTAMVYSVSKVATGEYSNSYEYNLTISTYSCNCWSILTISFSFLLPIPWSIRPYFCIVTGKCCHLFSVLWNLYYIAYPYWCSENGQIIFVVS